jgi:hypothetical protein
MKNRPKHPRDQSSARAERARRQHQEEALDDALKNTFPASDPVSIEQPETNTVQGDLPSLIDRQRHAKTFSRPSHGENRGSSPLGSASQQNQ